MATSHPQDDHRDTHSATAADAGIPTAPPGLAGAGGRGADRDATDDPRAEAATAGRAGLDGPDSGYEVGYGKPPQHSRFKPGQSGNPKGRKKGARGFKTLVKEVIEEKVQVRTATGSTKMTRLQAALNQCANQAAKGDIKALDTLIRIAREAGCTIEPDEFGQALSHQLKREDAALLERHLHSLAAKTIR